MSHKRIPLQSQLLWLCLALSGAALLWVGLGRLRSDQVTSASTVMEDKSVLFSRPAAAKDLRPAAEALPSTPPIDAIQPVKYETASLALG